MVPFFIRLGGTLFGLTVKETEHKHKLWNKTSESAWTTQLQFYARLAVTIPFVKQTIFAKFLNY